MSFSLQFPTGEEWFPLPVSLISIIKCCVLVLVLSVLEFLASAVRADASRSEAEPACCAVSTHTLTHPPDQLVGLYRNLYPRGQTITKVLLCRHDQALGIIQGFNSTSAATQTEKGNWYGISKMLNCVRKNHRIKFFMCQGSSGTSCAPQKTE